MMSVTSSLPGSESGNSLTSRNIRLSNASPFVIGNKYSTTGLSSQGTVVPQTYAGYTQQRLVGVVVENVFNVTK
jgi:hypothetical protein